MTQDEARNILEEYVKACKEDDFIKLEGFVYDEVIEAMSIGAKALSKPSLPSNLDEAAEKEIERFCSDILNFDIIWARMPLTKRFGLQMAKFGAEWMAGQGESRECTIGMATEEIHCHLSEEALERIGVSPGDKVIVQIRKK